MVPGIPNVSIVIVDNGSSAALSVPLSSIQLKMGVCIAASSAATPTIFATTQASSLQATLVGGDLVESGGMVCEAGGTVLAVTCPVATIGTATAVQTTATNGSTSAVTVTVDPLNGPWGTYYVWVKSVTPQSGTSTIGTAPGPSIQISLDAGRTFGPIISLGTSTSYVIGSSYTPPYTSASAGGTGLTINFGAGTLVPGDYWKFATVGPKFSQAGVQAAFNAYLASPYSINGVGSTHIVGISASSSSSDITAFQTLMQSAVPGFVFTRAIVELPDVTAPVAFAGGSGQTEAAWITSLTTITSGLTAQPRIAADGGNYNMPSPYNVAPAGNPAYRRPLAWAHAVRRTQIGITRRAGAVADGALSTILVNPSTDPNDGFVYHNERSTPGLNAGRIGSALTWPKQGLGFFMCQEPLLAPITSQFSELVIGNLVDAASDIAYTAGVVFISDNLVVNNNGTLNATVAANLQGTIQGALQLGLVASNDCSSVIALVSTTANVLATGNIPVQITVTPFGYVNSITFTINLNTAG